MPGAAKTRLIPAIGAAGAALIHRRLVERTLATVADSGLPCELRFTGAARSDFATWLGNSVMLAEQGDGDLGARMARVQAPAILLGADVPGLEVRHLRAAAEALVDRDVVVGPAEDGGYYLLGFRQPMPFLFDAMIWGTDRVLAETMRRLAARGIDPVTLETLADLDTPDDLARWPDLMP